jgi:hypothetical protein
MWVISAADVGDPKLAEQDLEGGAHAGATS